MKSLLIFSLIVLTFTTGFTCSKNTPTEQPAQQAAPPQEQMAAPATPAPEGEAAPATPPAEGQTAPTDAQPAAPTETK